ncbi:putative protein RADIALIS-like 4 [Cocos nucifera]|nr:putative protein RADIALIS-like 4 [Cocos nucifera]
MEDPDESRNGPSSWSWEDNKLFELALAVVDEGNPDRWEEVASIVGGKKSAEEVKRHYEVLLEDLDIIESVSYWRKLRKLAMEDPDESRNGPSSWSWEDNKLFELALAVVDEGNPDRWEEVASIVGGKKSAEEVKRHYEVLLEDLDIIESGRLDHAVGAPLSDTQDVRWTDEDQE